MMWPDWLTFRPIENWPGELTPQALREHSRFKAPFSNTVEELERELRHLNARNPVLQVAVTEDDIRLDGKPRANARPAHPGVILAYSRRGKSRRFATVEQARAFLAATAGWRGAIPPTNRDLDEKLYRDAARYAHPDTEDGSHEKFLKVKEAHRLLTADDTFQFAIDRYWTWHENLRAITLSLESLRRVSRYGVVKDDEQYSGWKQLTAGGVE